MANEYYYPWYPAHYRRDAGHLDHVADSCYRRLLDWYMESGEPIKKDAAKLMHIMGVSAPQFQAVWPQIEGFFQLSADGFLHHKRCNIELDRQDTLVKYKSLGGIRSAEKRRIQKQQYQLLINSSSTAVQQQYDGSATAVPPREGKVREGKVREESIKISLNGESGSAPPVQKRASAQPLPSDWEADLQYAERLGLMNGKAVLECEKFKAYWSQGKGSGSRKTPRGWRQAWFNWCGIAAERGVRGNGPATPPKDRSWIEGFKK